MINYKNGFFYGNIRHYHLISFADRVVLKEKRIFVTTIVLLVLDGSAFISDNVQNFIYVLNHFQNSLFSLSRKFFEVFNCIDLKNIVDKEN